MRIVKAILFVALAAAAARGLVTRQVAPDAAAGMTRARALRGLEGCRERPKHPDCGDLAADLLIDAYWRGDRNARVLKALLDAGQGSDAALAEGLGTFYAELLQKQPRVFVQAIASRPARERRDLCEAAGVVDGGGMSDEIKSGVKAGLRRIAVGRSPRLARVARQCWAAVDAADRRAYLNS